MLLQLSETFWKKEEQPLKKTVSVLIRATGTPPPQPSHVCWRGAGADAGGGRGGGRAGDGGPAAILIALPIRRPNHGESPRALSLEEFLRSLRSGNVCKRFSARKERRENAPVRIPRSATSCIRIRKNRRKRSWTRRGLPTGRSRSSSRAAASRKRSIGTQRNWITSRNRRRNSQERFFLKLEEGKSAPASKFAAI